MGDSYQKIQRGRLEQLKNLIEEEFSSEKFEKHFGPLISISLIGSGRAKERLPRIMMNPVDEFMQDMDSDLDRVFTDAIAMARHILKNPPFPDRNFQGTIVLDHGGVTFKERSTT
jgi:hypothetical protein